MKFALPRRFVCAVAACVFHAAAFAQLAANAAPTAVERENARRAAEAAADQAYRVGPEDVLDISVWKEDGLKRDVIVRPDGGFSFPLIGEVEAQGKSISQLREEISGRLERFIPDPVVTVAIIKISSQRVYVIGKVNKPGEFMIGRAIDVLQALSMAGGLTPFAASNDIKVVRRSEGRNVTFPFRYSDIERGQRLEQNITLLPGDVVIVP